MPAPSSSLHRSSGRHITCYRETRDGGLELRTMPLWGQYCVQSVFSIAFLGVFRLGIAMLPHIVGFVALGMGVAGVWMSWKGVNYKGSEFDSKRAIAIIRPVHSNTSITLPFHQLRTIEVRKAGQAYEVLLNTLDQEYTILKGWPYPRAIAMTQRIAQLTRCQINDSYS